MIGARERFTVRDAATGRLLTLLDCALGRHTGHFTITRVRIGGAVLWACDACIAAHQGRGEQG